MRKMSLKLQQQPGSSNESENLLRDFSYFTFLSLAVVAWPAAHVTKGHKEFSEIWLAIRKSPGWRSHSALSTRLSSVDSQVMQ